MAVAGDFRIVYTSEAALLAYARGIGFAGADGAVRTHGDLPDGSGVWFMTPALRVYRDAAAAPTEAAWSIPPGMDGLGGVANEDRGEWARTLRILGANPFGQGGLPLPGPETGVTIWPPTNPGVAGYAQPEVAVIA